MHPHHITILHALAILGILAAWVGGWTLALVAIADGLTKGGTR